MSYRGHHGLRSSSIECGWSCIQKDPTMQKRYEELRTKHTGKRAIVIIARKLLSRIYHVLKTGKLIYNNRFIVINQYKDYLWNILLATVDSI